MVYIRIKKISHKHYAYLVENKATAAGPRQKVLQYLGRVHQLQRAQNNNNNAVAINAKNKTEFLQQLVSAHLENHGFNKGKKDYQFHDLIYSYTDFTLSSKKKDAVLAINEGYLCRFTLQRIINFKKSKDVTKDAYLLAKYFLEAGLPLSQEQFVQFYQL